MVYVEDNKPDKAYALFKKIPPSPEKAQHLSEKISDVYYELALESQDREEAKKSIEKGLSLNPNHKKLGALKTKIARKEKIERQVESYYQQA